MNNKRQIQEKIDNYLFDLLSGEERMAFEQEMKEDAKLRNEVELTRQIMESFQINGEQEALKEIQNISSEEELRAILIEAEKKFHPKNNLRTKRLVIYISTTAAVILLLLYMGFQPKYSSQQLFNDYYNPDIYIPTASRGDSSELKQKQAQDLYDAVCMINTEQTVVAVDSLIRFSSSFESFLKEDAQWNLVLAYLKINKRDEAKKTLWDIVADDGAHRHQAQEILRKISRKKWF